MPWQLAVLLHNFLGGGRSVVNRLIGKEKQDITSYALLVGFFCVFCGGLAISFFDGNPVNHEAAWNARYFLLLGGTLFAILNFFNLKLYRLLPASIASILSTLNPLSVVLAAAALTEEVLTTRQWAGSVLLLFAVLLVSYYSRDTNKVKAKKKHKVSVALLVAIGIAIFFGFGIVNEKYVLDRIDIGTYVVYGWGAQLLSTVAVVASQYKKFVIPKTKTGHFYSWLHGLLLVSSGFFFVQSLVSSDNSSLTSISAAAKVVVAVALSYFILRERHHMMVKTISILISSAGLYLLFS